MSKFGAVILTATLFGVTGVAGPIWADDLRRSDSRRASTMKRTRTPDTTPAAEAFLLRAYPATDIPDRCHPRGPRRLGGAERQRAFDRRLAADRSEQGDLSRRAQSVPLRRGPVRGERPRHGDGDLADLRPGQMHALRRGGRRRRLAHGQGAQRLELAVHLRQLRHQRDRLAAHRSERSVRQHALRRHRRAERLGRFGSGRRHLQDDGRRPDLDARPGQRHLLPARDRADGARQRRQPAGPDRQRRARHQLGLERRVVERQRRSSARSRAASTDRPVPPSRSSAPIVAVATARGSTTVKVDPTHAGRASTSTSSRAGSGARSTTARRGRRSRRRSTPTLSTDRAEFDVTTLPNGNTRMYVGVGNQTDAGANRARFYRTDDASGAAGLHRHDDGAEHRLLHRPVLVRQRRLHAGRRAGRRLPRRLVLLRRAARRRRTAAPGCCRPTAARPGAISRRTAIRITPKRSIPTSTRSSRFRASRCSSSPARTAASSARTASSPTSRPSATRAA